MPPNEDSLFRQTLRGRLAAAQDDSSNQPAKVLCMMGNEARIVEVMACPEGEDYILVRTDATVKSEDGVRTEKILLHIQIDQFILVESA